MAGPASSFTGRDLCEIFKDKLANEWKREAACGAEYKNIQFYINTESLTKWMLRQDTDKRSTHAALLLLESYHRNHRETFQPAFSNSIFTGPDRCILVFSILLTLDKGDLVSVFRQAKIVDKNLEFADTFYEELKYDLGMKGVNDADRIITEFEKAKWSYCPAPIRMDMQEKFHGGKWILPFCRRQSVNTKGGTAEVYQVCLQEDLVPDDMKKKIWRSKHVDKKYGVCYRLALKSFPPRNLHFYTWERDAFLGIRGQTGMVQYLGHFSFDGAPFDPTSRTHNILLEFGDQDLDEYFADEVSYPPVRTGEIVVFWESLFKVADAIRKIHNLQFNYEDGTSELYHGWHADVKPDNILRVHGEFKLADFGFAKFKRRGEAVPTEVIEGGTQTYGSPEGDQSRVKAGTFTPVTQTIDTWSYGCVLSITATWIVLGFQGVRQFEALRIQAIKGLRRQKANNPSISTPTADDAFHNGKDPLPEVYDWHNYLRSILRRSDTATPRVLDLVDQAMLLSEPRRRIISSDLCDKLEDILTLSKIARPNRDQANGLSQSVLKALLDYEKKATESDISQGSESSQTPNSSINDERGSSLHVSEVRQYRKSKRVGKSERLEMIPRAKTANRMEGLARELNPTILVPGNDNPRRPSTTDVSKTELDTVFERPVADRDGSSKHFKPQKNNRRPERTRSPPKQVRHRSPVVLEPPSVSSVGTSLEQEHLYDSPFEHDDETSEHTRLHGKAPYRGRMPNPRNPRFSRDLSQGSTGDSRVWRPDTPDISKDLIRQPERYSLEDLAVRFEDDVNIPVPPPQPDTSNGYSQGPLQQTADVQPAPSDANGPIEEEVKPRASITDTVPGPVLPPELASGDSQAESGQVATTSPAQTKRTGIDDEPLPNYKVKTNQENAIVAPMHNRRTTIHAPPPEPSASTSQSGFSPLPEMANVEGGAGVMGYPASSPLSLSTVISVPSASATEPDASHDVYQVRQELDKVWPKGMTATLLSLTGLSATKKDAGLKKYIRNRDIKFVVDNGTTMLPFWNVATYVLETLAMKLAGLDDDGLDLSFTLGDTTLENEKGLQAPVNFKSAMVNAKPSSGGVEEKTDMRETLSEIFEEYLENKNAGKARQMTLIVLTDGIWKGSVSPEGVEEKIAEFLGNFGTLKDRAFSIQFVRFGDHPDAIERLRRLDDEMPKKFGIRDIIDTEPWTGNVRKMIIGSFNAATDAERNGETINGSPLLSPIGPSNTDSFAPPIRRSTDASHHEHGKRRSKFFGRRESFK